MQYREETASALAFTTATGGVALGGWLEEHLLQVIGIGFMILTFLVHLTVAVVRTKLAREEADRQRAAHARDEERHVLEMAQLQNIQGDVQNVRDTLDG